MEEQGRLRQQRTDLKITQWFEKKKTTKKQQPTEQKNPSLVSQTFSYQS